MELIERYIYAVTEQLPKDLKEDVGKELRANIEDMLPEDYTEEDVKRVLEQLGNPWQIAEEYQPRQRYLIGPALYSKYFTVLKLVVGIVVAVVASISIIGWFFTPLEAGDDLNNYVDLTVELLGAVVQVGLQAALWVTVIFAAIERGLFGKTENMQGLSDAKDTWSVRDLPTIPVQAKRIPRSGSVISIIVTMLFTSVLYFQPQLIGIFISRDGEHNLYSLLETERLQVYMPFILILAFVQIALFVWKYIIQYWNYSLLTAHIAVSVLASILLIVMIHDAALINNNFIYDVARLFNISDEMILRRWDQFVIVFVLTVIVITVWDAIDAFLKTRKKAA